MKEQLEKRVAELKREFEAGQQKLASVEEQADALRQTLLRISGAIQVLEEEIAKSGEAGKAADSSSGDGS
jgi:uncharacterized protein (DUF3084 family)